MKRTILAVLLLSCGMSGYCQQPATTASQSLVMQQPVPEPRFKEAAISLTKGGNQMLAGTLIMVTGPGIAVAAGFAESSNLQGGNSIPVIAAAGGVVWLTGLVFFISGADNIKKAGLQLSADNGIGLSYRF